MKNQTPFLFLKQNKTKMYHVTSSLNISFLTLVSTVVGCNLPSPWQQLPLFKFTLWQAVLNTPLSLSLCQEDGNAITPTPKDLNPNEWKTKEAMLRIQQRGRDPTPPHRKRLSVCRYSPTAHLGRSMDSGYPKQRSLALPLQCWLCSCIELFIAFRPKNSRLTPMSLPSI